MKSSYVISVSWLLTPSVECPPSSKSSSRSAVDVAAMETATSPASPLLEMERHSDLLTAVATSDGLVSEIQFGMNGVISI